MKLFKFNIEYKIKRDIAKLVRETPTEYFNFIVEEARRQINAFRKKDYTEKIKQIRRDIRHNERKWNKLIANLESYDEEEVKLLPEQDIENITQLEVKPILEPTITNIKPEKPIIINPEEMEEYENAIRLEIEGKPLEKQIEIINKSLKEVIESFQIDILNKISKELLDEKTKLHSS